MTNGVQFPPGHRFSLRREAVLREMGLAPLWRLRPTGAEAKTAPMHPVAETSPPPSPLPTVPTPSVQASFVPPPSVAPRSQASDSAAVPPLRKPPAPVTAPIAFDPVPHTGRAAGIAALDWEGLEAEIRACRECVLCQRRKQAVPGVGDRQARWMLVGEGPGAEEDQRGEPFVGQAGKLLDNMLRAISLKRGEDVYIGNAVKCRPPHNRTPESAELAACLPFLERQIDLVRPRLLIALGRPAAQALLATEVRIGAARGKLFDHRGIPVIVTYHPAYLLRNPQDKARAWEDLCFARQLMQSFAR